MRPFQFMIGTRGIPDRRALVENARMAERLRLCPLVFNNDLRHPAVLAQDLATLDMISEGRVVVGIGAGWNEPEYVAAGITFDAPGIRIDRMLEAVTVLRGLFADGSYSFAGRYYTITEMDGQPKPVQRPHPPFLIGGTRERVLRVAAREADIVSLDLHQDRASLRDAFPARMDERVGWVRDAAGARFDDLDLGVLRLIGKVTITGEPLRAAAAVARELEARTGLTIGPEDVLESPYSLIGSVPDLVEKLRRARERWGINSFLVGWFDDTDVAALAPVIEQLAGT